jgi:hypothetical protein
MKKLSLITLPFVILVSSLTAKVITVDNNAGSVAQYSNLGTAIAEADAGDTILIAGSPNAYGTFNVYKQLHFVGAGYFLAENSIPGLSSNVSTVSMTIKKDILKLLTNFRYELGTESSLLASI